MARGGWSKSKKEIFPRKLLIKRYIPTDSDQKKDMSKEEKTLLPYMYKKLLHLLKSPSLF